MKRIKSALISVYHKDGLEEIIKLLDGSGVTIYSTGGTLSFIESIGCKAVAVESLTGYPSIFGGRVKTLHPAVMGGILMRREQDGPQAAEHGIAEIDLVIVDLYPFTETVRSGGSEQEIIEKIDIGGISLIRAAAKNYKDVAIAGSSDQYAQVYEYLRSQDCSTTLEQRRNLAAKAFAVTSGYDTAIFEYFDRTEKTGHLRLAQDVTTPLRYGENPHQSAFFAGDLTEIFDQLHGKEISYNNLLDIDAAIDLMADMDNGQPAVAILKHNNACGAAIRPTLPQAWEAALACDPVSAFGGVIITNMPVDEGSAQEINKLFSEVIIAPDYRPEALEVLKSKKNRIILRLKNTPAPANRIRTLLGGYAVQERDSKVGGRDTEMQVATKNSPDNGKRSDLIFANTLVKHSKSNAIVLARDQTLLASGIGQTSRVDALRQAIAKAKSFGFDLRGAVMASDAYFPFADCVEIAHGEGIDCVIQPGGSVRDGESIEFCDNHSMAMVFTGTRHFKH